MRAAVFSVLVAVLLLADKRMSRLCRIGLHAFGSGTYVNGGRSFGYECARCGKTKVAFDYPPDEQNPLLGFRR